MSSKSEVIRFDEKLKNDFKFYTLYKHSLQGIDEACREKEIVIFAKKNGFEFTELDLREFCYNVRTDNYFMRKVYFIGRYLDKLVPYGHKFNTLNTLCKTLKEYFTL